MSVPIVVWRRGETSKEVELKAKRAPTPWVVETVFDTTHLVGFANGAWEFTAYRDVGTSRIGTLTYKGDPELDAAWPSGVGVTVLDLDVSCGARPQPMILRIQR